MSDQSSDKEHDWDLYRLDKALEISKSLFEQLLLMARYSLLFNGALGAAMGYLAKFTNVLDPGASAGGLGVVVTAVWIVSAIATIFNIGALLAHNNTWKCLGEISDFAKKLEARAQARNSGEAVPSSESGLFAIIGNHISSGDSPADTYWWTQYFFRGQTFGWMIFAIIFTCLAYWFKV